MGFSGWGAKASRRKVKKIEPQRTRINADGEMGKDLSSIEEGTAARLVELFSKIHLQSCGLHPISCVPPKRESSDGGIGRRARLRI